MPLSFLVDENVPYEIVEGLRRRNIIVFTLIETDLISAPDSDILQYAKDHSIVVYTRDADFLRLHAQGIEHSGIIYHHPLTYSIGEIIRRLVVASDIISLDDLRNQIRFL